MCYAFWKKSGLKPSRRGDLFGTIPNSDSLISNEVKGARSLALSAADTLWGMTLLTPLRQQPSDLNKLEKMIECELLRKHPRAKYPNDLGAWEYDFAFYEVKRLDERNGS